MPMEKGFMLILDLSQPHASKPNGSNSWLGSGADRLYHCTVLRLHPRAKFAAAEHQFCGVRHVTATVTASEQLNSELMKQSSGLIDKEGGFV